jgi:methyl-accepting chemotaxis protein
MKSPVIALPTSMLPASLGRLAVKMPAFVILSVLMCGALVGAAAYFLARSAMIDQNQTVMGAIANYRSGILSGVMDGMKVDINQFAERADVRAAMRNLQGAYAATDGGAATIQTHYVEKSPMPAGKRADYDGAADSTRYGLAHQKEHGFLRRFAKDKAYYDLFLINLKGDVVYTMEKEADFATNLRDGKWRGTGLARAFEAALAAKEANAIEFQDYEAYAPSNGDPAAFFARAIRDEAGAAIGVVAVRLPSDTISAQINKPVGQTGDVFAVAADGTLRTVLPKHKDHPINSKVAMTDVIREALAGKRAAGVTASVIDGESVSQTAAPLEFYGKKWAVVTEVDMAEVESPIKAMGYRILLIVLGVVVAMGAVNLFFARTIYGPVLAMRDAVSRIAAGEAADIPGEARGDELGELARALRQVHDAGVAAARIRSALDNAGTNVMVADEKGNVIYSNKGMIRFFSDYAHEFRKQFPNFSPNQMLGAYMDSFHKNPAEIQRRVAGLTEPFRARIKIGELTLELVICPAFDANGQRLGTLVEWNNLTDDLKAMGEVTQVVEAATSGDFSNRVREDDKKGVVLHLGGGINRICNLVETAMQEFTDTMKRISEGDLTTKISTQHQGRFADMAAGINETIAQLSEMVATIQNSTRDITAAAREINAGATDLAKRTEEEAASLEETAATTEQLAASVKQTADSARTATDLSAKARGVAAEGDAIVSDAVTAIERIERASAKISEIIGVIDDIAFQTNLLALNAAVEAARAGEAGKGFAVVASEVRTLAQRSGQAAKDIKGLIVNSTEQVVEGVKLVRATGQSLQNIVAASAQVAETVVMISSATHEQANGIEEMSTTVARIDEMTQQNSALAEESAASANELINQIDRLNRLVEVFRIDGQAARPATEPDRLRQLAADAFAQSKVTTPRPQPAMAAPARQPASRVASASRGGRDDWAEF